MLRRGIVLLACLALAGCGGGGGGGDGTVSFQVFGDNADLEIYREIVAAYKAETGKTVQLIEAADRDAHLAKLTTSFAAARPPDVFLLNYRNFGPFQRRNVVEPVAGRLQNAGDYYEAPLDAFTVGGQLQCLPQNASPLVVYVNRGLFEDAGVRIPDDEWTYDDMIATARRLRDWTVRAERAAGTHALGVDPGLIRLSPFIWAAGGEVVDDIDAPKAFTFRTEAAKTGIDRFLALYRLSLTPTELQVESRPMDQRFFEGKLAMYMSSRRETALFRTAEDLDFDVLPFPKAEQPGSVLHSDAFCIARGTDVDAAWDFVAFAGGPKGQELMARGGRIVPSLRTVAESDAFLAPDERPRNARVFLEQLSDLRRLPNTANWPAVEDAASLAFKRSYYAEIPVDQAIDRIEAETNGKF
jgi:multiple sugar transport system substrate-binding protein